MISETRERFLRAIIGIVPAERIVEIHFFPPIKQGGVESGVAVVAAGEPSVPAPAIGVPAGARPSEGLDAPAMAPTDAASATDAEIDSATAAPHATAAEVDEAPEAAAEIDELQGASGAASAHSASDHPTAVAYPVEGPADLAPRQEADEEPADNEGLTETLGGNAAAHQHPPHESMAAAVDAAADEPVVRDRAVALPGRAAATVTDDIPTTPVLDDLASGEELSADFDGPPDDEAPALRFTVFTARYRLVLKGPDRGKWEASTVAEADAPLLTVEAVVRGVQRRSGDVDDPERMSGDEVRAELARMDAAAEALRKPASLRAG